MKEPQFVSVGASARSTARNPTLTFNHTLASGIENGFVVAFLNVINNNNLSAMNYAVTYGNVLMNLIGFRALGADSNNNTMGQFMYTQHSPLSGTQQVKAVLTGMSVSGNDSRLQIAVYSGVKNYSDIVSVGADENLTIVVPLAPNGLGFCGRCTYSSSTPGITSLSGNQRVINSPNDLGIHDSSSLDTFTHEPTTDIVYMACGWGVRLNGPPSVDIDGASSVTVGGSAEFESTSGHEIAGNGPVSALGTGAFTVGHQLAATNGISGNSTADFKVSNIVQQVNYTGWWYVPGELPATAFTEYAAKKGTV